MAYGWAMVGTPVAFLSAERFWQGQHFVWFLPPVEARRRTAPGPGGVDLPARCHGRRGARPRFVGICLLDRMSGTVRTVGGAVAAVPASWWVYTVGTCSSPTARTSPTASRADTMAAFPLFVAFAWKLPRSMEGAVVGVMACLPGCAPRRGAQLRRAPDPGRRSSDPRRSGRRASHRTSGAQCQRHTSWRIRPGSSTRPFAHSNTRPRVVSGPRRARGTGAPGPRRRAERPGVKGTRADVPRRRRARGARRTPIAAKPEGSGEPKG